MVRHGKLSDVAKDAALCEVVLRHNECYVDFPAAAPEAGFLGVWRHKDSNFAGVFWGVFGRIRQHFSGVISVLGSHFMWLVFGNMVEMVEYVGET